MNKYRDELNVNPKEVINMNKEMDLHQLYSNLLPLLEDSISAFELARWTENFQIEKQSYQEAVDIIKNFYFQIKENKEEVLYVIKIMQERFYWLSEEYYKEQLEEITKDFVISEFRNKLLQKIQKSIRLLDEARDIKEDEDLTEEEKEEQIKRMHNEIISYFEEVYTNLNKNEDFDTLFFTLEILQVIATKDIEYDLRQELIEIQNKIRKKFKHRYSLRYR